MARVSTTEIGERGAASVRWLIPLALLFLLAAPAKASSTFFNNTGTICTAAAPCWQAGMFGMLIGTSNGLGGYNAGTLTESSGSIDTLIGTGPNSGAVGIGTGSIIDTHLGAAQTWTGPIDFADTGSATTHGYTVPSASDNLTNVTVTGGTKLGQTYVDAALDQILGISNYWAGASGQTSLGALNKPMTIGTIGAGIQVFSVTSINLTKAITIQGNSTDLIIINDPGAAVFGSGGSNHGNIVLSGGITPDQVLFNLTGTGNVLSISGGDTLSADFILKQGSYNLSNATVNGRILGGQGTLTLGASFEEIAPPVPEPGAWGLMAGGIGVLLYLGRRLRKRSRRP
jgi:hypothetical protein